MKKIMLMMLVAVLVAGFSLSGVAADRGYANPEMVISAEELHSDLESGEDIAILDVTNKMNYTKAHIPGAVSIWGGEMATTNQVKGEDVKGLILPPQEFEDVMEEKGISNNTRVVVYDHSGGLWATRVWWMLQVYNHQGQVQLLDGGIKAWQNKDYDVNHLPEGADEGSYTVNKVNEDMIISTSELNNNLGQSDFAVIDTRSAAEYKGEKALGGANRAGRIPGAIHIEWTENSDENGLLKPASELKKLYQNHGVTPDKEIAMYCHTSVRATYNYFALKLIGYPNLKIYDAAWVGWANDPSLEIE
ncbi:sulfurtransferase [Halanaerobacter jeridensis]|uniref:thiosulfate sulfurtransferase n=1 Tax=Halanaerobacter jeridensis TaxID=706427 RepID=A0A939BP24_9FIRM|nr:sulfurtransferase [Halanaerobacter jeridensis]MBM7556417.1 thiosulfate/3-mercaptopyruvate sulfurtransferase [Halanaerobacter jeridensis]